MKINYGYENIVVNILNIDFDPFEKMWNFYKVIWYKTDEKEYDENDDEIQQTCLDMLNGKTLPAPLESLNIQFRIEGISRVGLARITRSRGWLFNSFSQAPQEVKRDFIIPKNILNKYPEIKEYLKEYEKIYLKLLEDGIPPQDARYITPMGQTGVLNCSTNFNLLKRFCNFRMCNGIADELNMICRLLKLEIKDKINRGKLHRNWEFLSHSLQPTCMKKKVCNNVDIVYGNCGRFNNVDTKYEQEFNKSGWYEELKEMDKVFLEEGEDKIYKR